MCVHVTWLYDNTHYNEHESIDMTAWLQHYKHNSSGKTLRLHAL